MADIHTRQMKSKSLRVGPDIDGFYKFSCLFSQLTRTDWEPQPYVMNIGILF